MEIILINLSLERGNRTKFPREQITFKQDDDITVDVMIYS